MTRRNPFELIGSKNNYEVTSAHDLMVQAGLNWKVSLNDVYAAGSTDPILIEDKYATVRTDNNGLESILSVVGTRYKVFQNEEIFSSLDSIVGAGDARYGSAGELKGGKIVWSLLELPDNVSVGDDPHRGYILARTSHDGSTPFQLTPIMNRISCTNQINARMVQGAKTGLYYSIRHSQGNDIDINEVKSALTIIRKDMQEYVRVSTWLRGQEFTNEQFFNFTKRVFALPTKIEFAADEFLSVGEKRAKTRALLNRSNAVKVWLGDTETQDNIKNTKFGAFQAIIEVSDHMQRSQIKQAEKIVLGTDVNLKSKAFELLGV